MQKTIAPHLASTYQLLQCAFPQGIDERQWFLIKDEFCILSKLHNRKIICLHLSKP